MENEEYPSDSEQSDVDFCPEDVGSDVSEEIESGSADEQSDGGDEKSHKKKKLNKKLTNNNKRNVRSTRTTQCKENTVLVIEKDNLESDEDNDDEKKRSNALWADFLNDTNSTTTTNTTKNIKDDKKVVLESTKSILKKLPINDNSTKNLKATNEPSTLCKGNLKVTEILEFAGEEIKVTKEIPIDNNKNISTTSKELPKFNKGPMKRSGGGGLGSILGQIGKKTKISVLEKSKLDWDGFKKNEGLTEELQTFNKGKDGYLERQDFLQRTDYRQFEIEKNLRQNKRNN